MTAAARGGIAAGGITGINHVGQAVRDFAQAEAAYAAMGFRLTPYSAHLGSAVPGGPVVPIGSGNRCLMFGSDYLEILGAESPAHPAPRVDGFLARHQGGHILCFEAEDLPGVEARFPAAGIPTSGILALQREVDTPDGPRLARFERLQFAPRASPAPASSPAPTSSPAPASSPEGLIQVARHLTPEFIYQPRHRAHPNGCDGLVEAVLVADDLPALSATYETYLGASPARPETGVARFSLPSGQRLTILDLAAQRRLLPGTLLPPVPGILAAAYRTPDRAALERCLAGSGLPVSTLPDGRRMVPAEACCGLATIFED